MWSGICDKARVDEIGFGEESIAISAIPTMGSDRSEDERGGERRGRKWRWANSQYPIQTALTTMGTLPIAICNKQPNVPFSHDRFTPS